MFLLKWFGFGSEEVVKDTENPSNETNETNETNPNETEQIEPTILDYLVVPLVVYPTLTPSPINPTLYKYTFKPIKDFKPTGTCDFSRINQEQLIKVIKDFTNPTITNLDLTNPPPLIRSVANYCKERTHETIVETDDEFDLD